MTAEVEVNYPDVLLNGKRMIGVMGGGGQTPDLLMSLMELQRDGRFPLVRLRIWQAERPGRCRERFGEMTGLRFAG